MALDIVMTCIQIAQKVKELVELFQENNDTDKDMVARINGLEPSIQALETARSRIPKNKWLIFERTLHRVVDVMAEARETLQDYLRNTYGSSVVALLKKTQRLMQAESIQATLSDMSAKITQVSGDLTQSLSAATFLTVSDKGMTASALCQHETAKQFWTRYFQEEREVKWEEFISSYEQEYGQQPQSKQYLIKKCLDINMDWGISVSEFAAFTNELGLPESFNVLFALVESEVDDLSLKWSDELRIEEFVQKIGKQLKLDKSEVEGAVNALYSNLFKRVEDLRSLSGEEWLLVLRSGLPIRLGITMKQVITEMEVSIPVDAAIASYISLVQKYSLIPLKNNVPKDLLHVLSRLCVFSAPFLRQQLYREMLISRGAATHLHTLLYNLRSALLSQTGNNNNDNIKECTVQCLQALVNITSFDVSSELEFRRKQHILIDIVMLYLSCQEAEIKAAAQEAIDIMFKNDYILRKEAPAFLIFIEDLLNLDANQFLNPAAMAKKAQELQRFVAAQQSQKEAQKAVGRKEVDMYDQDDVDEHEPAVPNQKRGTGKDLLLVPVSSSSASPTSTARTAWKEDKEKGDEKSRSKLQLHVQMANKFKNGAKDVMRAVNLKNMFKTKAQIVSNDEEMDDIQDVHTQHQLQQAQQTAFRDLMRLHSQTSFLFAITGKFTQQLLAELQIELMMKRWKALNVQMNDVLERTLAMKVHRTNAVGAATAATLRRGRAGEDDNGSGPIRVVSLNEYWDRREALLRRDIEEKEKEEREEKERQQLAARHAARRAQQKGRPALPPAQDAPPTLNVPTIDKQGSNSSTNTSTVRITTPTANDKNPTGAGAGGPVITIPRTLGGGAAPHATTDQKPIIANGKPGARGGPINHSVNSSYHSLSDSDEHERELEQSTTRSLAGESEHNDDRSSTTTSTHHQQNDAFSPTHTVLNTLTHTFFQCLINCETGQRGYLLTKKKNYLRPFLESKPRCYELLDQLLEATAGDAHAQKLLREMEPLVQLKLAELQQTIDLRHGDDVKGLEGALAIVKNDSGNNWMIQMRSIVKQLLDYEADKAKAEKARRKQHIRIKGKLPERWTAYNLGYLVRVDAGAGAGAGAGEGDSEANSTYTADSNHLTPYGLHLINIMFQRYQNCDVKVKGSDGVTPRVIQGLNGDAQRHLLETLGAPPKVLKSLVFPNILTFEEMVNWYSGLHPQVLDNDILETKAAFELRSASGSLTQHAHNLVRILLGPTLIHFPRNHKQLYAPVEEKKVDNAKGPGKVIGTAPGLEGLQPLPGSSQSKAPSSVMSNEDLDQKSRVIAEQAREQQLQIRLYGDRASPFFMVRKRLLQRYQEYARKFNEEDSLKREQQLQLQHGKPKGPKPSPSQNKPLSMAQWAVLQYYRTTPKDEELSRASQSKTEADRANEELLLWMRDLAAQDKASHVKGDEGAPGSQLSPVIHNLFQALLNCETGQRGFLLTGKPNYLKPFLDSKPRTFQLYRDLYDATMGDSGAQELLYKLGPLIQCKIAELQQTIDLRADPKKGLKEALVVVKSDLGNAWMKDMREIVHELLAYEQARSKISRDDAKKLTQQNAVPVTAIAMRCHDLFEALLNCETGQRGFLLTRDINYLKPFLDNKPYAASLYLDLLKIASKSGPEDTIALHLVQSLGPMIREKLDELQLTVDYGKQNDFEKALDTVNNDSGNNVMSEMRETVKQLLEYEAAKRETELKKQQHHEHSLSVSSNPNHTPPELETESIFASYQLERDLRRCGVRTCPHPEVVDAIRGKSGVGAGAPANTLAASTALVVRSSDPKAAAAAAAASHPLFNGMCSNYIDTRKFKDASLGFADGLLPQVVYRCLTCRMPPNTGVCEACKITCHAGHDTARPRFYPRIACYCGTGCGGEISNDAKKPEQHDEKGATDESDDSGNPYLRIQLLTHNLFECLLNCETGQRGYLLTGRPEYLQPFTVNKPECYELISQLRAAIRPDARVGVEHDPYEHVYVEELDKRVRFKLDELQLTVNLRTNKDDKKGLADALEVVNDDSGNNIMAEMRVIVHELLRYTAAKEVSRRRKPLARPTNISYTMFAPAPCHYRFVQMDIQKSTQDLSSTSKDSKEMKKAENVKEKQSDPFTWLHHIGGLGDHALSTNPSDLLQLARTHWPNAFAVIAVKWEDGLDHCRLDLVSVTPDQTIVDAVNPRYQGARQLAHWSSAKLGNMRLMALDTFGCVDGWYQFHMVMDNLDAPDKTLDSLKATCGMRCVIVYPHTVSTVAVAGDDKDPNNNNNNKKKKKKQSHGAGEVIPCSVTWIRDAVSKQQKSRRNVWAIGQIRVETTVDEMDPTKVVAAVVKQQSFGVIRSKLEIAMDDVDLKANDWAIQHTIEQRYEDSSVSARQLIKDHTHLFKEGPLMCLQPAHITHWLRHDPMQTLSNIESSLRIVTCAASTDASTRNGRSSHENVLLTTDVVIAIIRALNTLREKQADSSTGSSQTNVEGDVVMLPAGIARLVLGLCELYYDQLQTSKSISTFVPSFLRWCLEPLYPQKMEQWAQWTASTLSEQAYVFLLIFAADFPNGNLEPFLNLLISFNNKLLRQEQVRAETESKAAAKASPSPTSGIQDERMLARMNARADRADSKQEHHVAPGFDSACSRIGLDAQFVSEILVECKDKADISTARRQLALTDIDDNGIVSFLEICLWRFDKDINDLFDRYEHVVKRADDAEEKGRRQQIMDAIKHALSASQPRAPGSSIVGNAGGIAGLITSVGSQLSNLFQVNVKKQDNTNSVSAAAVTKKKKNASDGQVVNVTMMDERRRELNILHFRSHLVPAFFASQVLPLVVEDGESTRQLVLLMLLWLKAGRYGQQLVHEILIPPPLAYHSIPYNPYCSPSLVYLKQSLQFAAENTVPLQAEATLTLFMAIFAEGKHKGSLSQLTDDMEFGLAVEARSSKADRASKNADGGDDDDDDDAASITRAESVVSAGGKVTTVNSEYVQQRELDKRDVETKRAGAEGDEDDVEALRQQGEAENKTDNETISETMMDERTRHNIQQIKQMLIDLKIAVDIVDYVLPMAAAAAGAASSNAGAGSLASQQAQLNSSKQLGPVCYSLLLLMLDYDTCYNQREATVVSLLLHNREFVKLLITACWELGFEPDKPACKLLRRLVEESRWLAARMAAFCGQVDPSHALAIQFLTFMDRDEHQCQTCGQFISNARFECVTCSDPFHRPYVLCERCHNKSNHKRRHHFRYVQIYTTIVQKPLEEETALVEMKTELAKDKMKKEKKKLKEKKKARAKAAESGDDPESEDPSLAPGAPGGPEVDPDHPSTGNQEQILAARMADQAKEDRETLHDSIHHPQEGSGEWRALHPRNLSARDLYILKRWSSKPLSRKPPTTSVVTSTFALQSSFAALGIGSGPGASIPHQLLMDKGTYMRLLAHKSTSRDAVGAMYERLQQALKAERETADKLRTGIWYEGWLHKAPGAACLIRTWPRRYAVLSIFALSLYKEKPSGPTYPHGQYQGEPPLDYVDLLNVLGKCSPFEHETKERCFQIPLPAGKVRVFHVAEEDCTTGKEREPRGWIDALNAAVAHVHTLPAGSRPSTYVPEPPTSYFHKGGTGPLISNGVAIEALVIGYRNGL